MKTKPLDKCQDNNLQPLKSNATFPSSRYFQVHFEYLQEMMGDIKNQLNTSNQNIALLQQQLSEVIPIVSEETNQNH
jgi:hypothetical protein